MHGRGGHVALPAVRRDAVAPFVLSAAAVGALGLESGGYYATTWSIATVAALVVAVAAVLRTRAVRIDRTYLVAFVGFVGWVALEAARAGAATRGVPELERDVLYLTVAWAALQLLRRSTVDAALAGIVTAIVALLADGLVHALLPLHIGADAYEGRFLFRPLGYANACGALAAIGIVIALGFAVRSRRAATALVPLAVALTLTGSRGAALALAIGLVVLAGLHPLRAELTRAAMVLLPGPAAAALFALHSHVADDGAGAATVARDCILVAGVTCAATVLQAFVAVQRRPTIRVPNAVVAVLAGATVVTTVVAATLGIGDRGAYWHVAWLDARAHPWLGSGPGTFAREWLAHRTVPTGALNAHNLYLETLAELGPLGLALLVATLAVPLVVAVRRRSPVAAVAAAAYTTFLGHAAVDWDWQMPAVTVAGLLCGVCALRASAEERTSSQALRPTLAVASGLALAVAAAGVGNAELAAAAHDRSADAARAAAALQPWSAEPRRLLAELALADGGRVQARRLLGAALRRDPGDAAAWYDVAVAGTAAQRRVAVDRLARLDPFAVSRRAVGAGSP